MKIQNHIALQIAEDDTIPAERRRYRTGKPAVITANWTGEWPCLCHGEWVITIDGEKVDLPEDVKFNNMNTYGTYNTWTFDSNWREEWNSYEDGLRYPEWVTANQSWLQDLALTDSETQELYDAISAEDWRHGSCGGCI